MEPVLKPELQASQATTPHCLLAWNYRSKLHPRTLARAKAELISVTLRAGALSLTFLTCSLITHLPEELEPPFPGGEKRNMDSHLAIASFNVCSSLDFFQCIEYRYFLGNTEHIFMFSKNMNIILFSHAFTEAYHICQGILQGHNINQIQTLFRRETRHTMGSRDGELSKLLQQAASEPQSRP